MPRRSRNGRPLARRVHALVPSLVIAGFCATSLFAVSPAVRAQAATPRPSLAYTIERGPLGDAIAALARQAHVAIEVDPALVRGTETAPMRGEAPLGAALERLLAPHRLQAIVRSDDRYVVQPLGVGSTDA